MADKTLKTRIKLKYDTLANWQGDGASVVLLKGEIAVCEVPTGGSLEQVTPPAILFKVGDGVKTFAQLPWASALAADVYAWAKAANKPTYSTSEITGLTSALAGKENAGVAAGLIAALDSEAAVQSGKFITGFELVDGKVTNVKYGEPAEVAIPEYTLVAGTDGSLTLKKDGAAVSENIKVTGWDGLVSRIGAVETGLEGKQDTLTAGSISKDLLASGVQASLGKADTALQADDLTGYATTSSVTSAINTHNTSSTAHNDIRTLISNLSGRVDGLGNALHFVGTGSKLPGTGKDGDVFIGTGGDIDGKEYVYSGDAWVEFGSGDHITQAQADGWYDAKGTAQNLINGLDATISGLSAGKTITALTQANGVISATASNIAITRSQVTDLLKYGTVSTLSIGDVTNLQTTLDDKLESADIAGLATTSALNAAIAGLDKADAAVANQYVTAVSETDGVISVTRKQIAWSEISGKPTIPSAPAAGKLLDAAGIEIFNANQTDNSTIIVIDCGSATELVD